jgi:hypothetical protein
MVAIDGDSTRVIRLSGKTLEKVAADIHPAVPPPTMHIELTFII